MSENTVIGATLELTVDPAKTKQAIDGAAKTVKTRLQELERGTGAAAGNAAGQSIAKSVEQASGKIKEATGQISEILAKGLKLGLGAGGTAIAAFLKSNTAEALTFKSRLSELQTALGGVGQKLAFNVKFGGKSMYEWAEKLTQYLNRLDTSQLQKAADIVTKIAVAYGLIKSVSIGAGAVKAVSGLAGLAGAGAAGQVAGAAGAAGVAGAGVGAAAVGASALFGGAATWGSVNAFRKAGILHGIRMANGISPMMSGAVAGYGLASKAGTAILGSRLVLGAGVGAGLYGGYQAGQAYFNSTQGYRPGLVGDENGAGIIDSLAKYGLRRQGTNWFDRLFGAKDQPGYMRAAPPSAHRQRP